MYQLYQRQDNTLYPVIRTATRFEAQMYAVEHGIGDKIITKD